jgi:hypothetical protein
MASVVTGETREINNGVPPQLLDTTNRRIQRISLPLPVRIEVIFDKDNGWNEITRLVDLSAFGAAFVLKRPIKRGRVVLLTLPMPRQLRSYDYSEPQYKIWALVRRCIQTSEIITRPEYSIGVAFIGKNPPPGFVQHPSKLYEITHRDHDGSGLWHIAEADVKADDSHLPKELRKQTRFFIPEVLVLEQTNADGEVVMSETTVSENVSYSGAAIFTTMKIPAGTILRLKSERYGVEIMSIVRGSRTGTDGMTRLHLEFVDRYFPLEGIETD